jgi:hypothetical protein
MDFRPQANVSLEKPGHAHCSSLLHMRKCIHNSPLNHWCWLGDCTRRCGCSFPSTPPGDRATTGQPRGPSRLAPATAHEVSHMPPVPPGGGKLSRRRMSSSSSSSSCPSTPASSRAPCSCDTCCHGRGCSGCSLRHSACSANARSSSRHTCSCKVIQNRTFSA